VRPVSRNARLSLIVVALFLSVAAFILRAFGTNKDVPWWEIVLPGVAAAALVYLLIDHVRRTDIEDDG
jgi:uncharacterized BrkB/YihY/UPF0761 family membrane protein